MKTNLVSSIRLPSAVDEQSSREAQLQRLVSVYVVTGLLFMLLPGTFLGVWNLISISNRHALAALSAAWLQAHGHAQIFGWIGTFVIGIGYYSLSKMGRVLPFAVIRGWLSWGLWTSGLVLRWVANVNLWHWRVLLSVSAVLELAAFLIFFLTVSRHKSGGERRAMETWMKLIVASTVGFLILLLINLGAAAFLSLRGESPAMPPAFDQRFLVLAAWGFPVLSVWGFNARWLPVFLGLKQPSSRGLMAALSTCAAGVITALIGYLLPATVLLLIASLMAAGSVNIGKRALHPAKTIGIHPTFPLFVRVCYVWLVVASALSIWAALADANGGIWGSSRHALTVGFLAGMIFAIGQRVLPAFCGMRQLFSSRMMFVSLVTLNIGCLLRVSSEIPAYEGYSQVAWHVLPCSAILELIAVTLFALNIVLSLVQPPAHLKHLRNAASSPVSVTTA